ncbi:putative epidermal cell surface receptor isoform X2 [Dermacentor albipictus]|uniref:putative epidermal cell surface receptor isoform X2 n=1 Tax=Dermacentor albipictus TaxID=60249 RepID=UPI0038FC4E39
MGSTAGFKLASAGQPRSRWFSIASALVVLSLAYTDAWPALDSTTLDSNGSDAADAALVRGATGLPVACACGADVAKCPAGRTAKTPSRCPPCGLVCARQTGEACSVDEPCAKDFGLSCDPVSFTCKGKLLIQKMAVTHNSVSLQWRMRQYPTPYPGVFYTPRYVGSDTRWTNAEPNDHSVMLKNLRPNTEYVVRIMQDGTQEMIVVRTKDMPTPAAAKVLVTQVTPSSVGLAWDDFKLPSYDSGYVVQHRLLTANRGDAPWEREQFGNIPLATLDNLKPQTGYQVQVSVWDDKEAGKLGATSEILTVFTADGCVRYNRTYRVGDEFTEGCDLRCVCRGNDEGDCKERCQEPYVRAGAMASDPLCYEKALPDDPCCVSVRCAHSKNHPHHDPSLRTYSQKSGHCPEIVEDQSTDPDSCSNECNSDFECAGVLKCCPSSCGGAVCVEPFSGKDPCDNVFCGPNALCMLENASPVCRCRSGYSGDPNNATMGCSQGGNGVVPADTSSEPGTGADDHSSTPSPSDTCVYKNRTYPVDEYFYDGCGLKCHCTDQTEVECQQRCLFSLEEPPTGNLDPGCEILTDPNDPCCKILACEASPNGTVAIQNVTAPGRSSEAAGNETGYVKNDVEETVTEKMLVDTGRTTVVNVLEPGDANVTENPLGPANVTAAGNSIGSDGNSNASRQGGYPGKLHRFDGCEFRGKVYQGGETFFDGCEARCTCSGKGHLACLPRCNVISAAGGDTCKEVADPNDACCRVLVCSPPGDTQAPSSVEGLKLLIEMAEPENGTTVKIRWTMLHDNRTTHMAGDAMIQVWYAVVTKDGGPVQWMKHKYKLSDMRSVPATTSSFEIRLGGLQPETEYYLRLVKPPSEDSDAEHAAASSNTVKVKTFAPAVRASFNGCVHRNRTYDPGMVFYDGCDHKCVCHAEGLVECQDRCEVYVDTVGYEDCQWAPAPDDACCMIPYCDGKPPVPRKPNDPQQDVCLDESGKPHRLGDEWETGQGCLRRVCTCVLLANGSALAECVGGCPPLSVTVRSADKDCPQPVVVTPDDPCLCPYVMCNGPRGASVPAPPPNTAVAAPQPGPAMCKYNGRLYSVNEEFYNGCLEVCHCGANLRVNCAIIECPHHFNQHFSECLEWDIDPAFQPSPPNCCPPSKCKKDGSCLFNGVKFRNFQQIPQEMLDCGKRCVCVNGNVSCENRCPPLNSSPPPTLPCHPAQAYRGHLPGDECCTHWMCREPEKPAVHCLFHGERYKLHEEWEMVKGSVRRQCSCKLRATGAAEAECTSSCPAIPERFQKPNPQCPRPVVVTPNDPGVCPYIVCSPTQPGKELQNVSVVAVNSTAIRVRFTLSNILIGLVGHAELHFTTDPLTPRETWSTQKFARPKRLFDTANIEYYLPGLRPDTTYFFQIQIIIDSLQSGPESQVFKLTMPPEPTTTTTVPPLLLLDMMMAVNSIDPHTAKVSWRPLDSREKKYVDGLQIRYKMNGQDHAPWKTTPMIHRDRTSYLLQDLEPSASYLIDMQFAVPEGLPTRIESSQHVEMRTAPVPKDEYQFELIVNVKRTEQYSASLVMDGIPEPITKYVHVFNVMYKSEAAAEHIQRFMVLKEPKILLEDLKPGQRYKVWVDAYLTNGKTTTSNILDFHTKPGPPPTTTTTSTTTSTTTESNEIEDSKAVALHSVHQDNSTAEAYYIALIVVAIVAAVAGLAFAVVLVLLLRRQSTAKAPITRNPSESAYDNPTYKTYDGEKPEEKNGNVQA